mmetsp:Transcript_3854/g.9371  ORF Transcript_3854/g.9371 Transcript_3854/m.9371 type:complete len:419 (+) Transcript_3854:539-1795(+)
MNFAALLRLILLYARTNSQTRLHRHPLFFNKSPSVAFFSFSLVPFGHFCPPFDVLRPGNLCRHSVKLRLVRPIAPSFHPPATRTSRRTRTTYTTTLTHRFRHFLLDLLYCFREVAFLIRRPEKQQDRHKPPHCEQQAQAHGQRDHGCHLGEEGEGAAEHEESGRGRGARPREYCRAHVLQRVSGFRQPPPQPLLGGLHPNVAHVERVVDREPDHDDAGDHLHSAQGPAKAVLEGPHHSPDDLHDGKHRETRQVSVLCRQQQHAERKGEAQHHPQKQRFLQRHLDPVPGPCEKSGLDRLAQVRGRRQPPPDERLEGVVHLAPDPVRPQLQQRRAEGEGQEFDFPVDHPDVEAPLFGPRFRHRHRKSPSPGRLRHAEAAHEWLLERLLPTSTSCRRSCGRWKDERVVRARKGLCFDAGRR